MITTTATHCCLLGLHCFPFFNVSPALWSWYSQLSCKVNWLPFPFPFLHFLLHFNSLQYGFCPSHSKGTVLIRPHMTHRPLNCIYFPFCNTRQWLFAHSLRRIPWPHPFLVSPHLPVSLSVSFVSALHQMGSFQRFWFGLYSFVSTCLLHDCQHSSISIVMQTSILRTWHVFTFLLCISIQMQTVWSSADIISLHYGSNSRPLHHGP